VTNVVAAVDCGSTSVRVCRVDLDAPVLTPDVVHRVAHVPRRDLTGHLRWEWDVITGAVVEGLDRCVRLGSLASIGVDTWAVDYGLLDQGGRLLADPFCYRDGRTRDYRGLVDAFGAERMYAISGLQLQPFNTIFQLAAHDRGELERAERLLWLPELIVHHLTGVALTERTSAGSSGLVDVNAGDWSQALLDAAGVDRALVGDIRSAGRVVGDWRGIPVSLVGGHDTASAVAGMGRPSPGGSAFVASGTWMLVGVERPEPDTSDWAREHNYSNEAAALGGTRFLRNVAGFWLLEQCRPAWGELTIEQLLARAATFGDDVPVVDVDDERLRAPDDMLAEYTRLASLAPDADPGLVTRSIVESIAVRGSEVIGQLKEASSFADVVLFGGAARSELLTRRLTKLGGRPVRVGSAEAAALGNAIVQGVAIGAFASLDEGRARVDGADPSPASAEPPRVDGDR
jgi:rhamnulokinase